jgi:hypothetical protein
MSSSRTISLFSERPEPNQRPSSFVVSIVAHAAATVLLSFGIIYTPEINDRVITKRYIVRHLDLHTPKTLARQSAGKGIRYPGVQAVVDKPAKGPKPAAQQAVLRQTADADKGPQTLVQPDISEPVKLALETPVPSLTIWTPTKVEVKKLVAPLPEKTTAADVKPSVNTPSQEVNLADISVASIDHPTAAFPVFPSTTSPLVVHGPEVQLAPVTVTQKAAQPTPTAVMSISDLRMPDGTATLPPVSETELQSERGTLIPGQAASGDKANRSGGKGNDPGSGDSGEPTGVAGNLSGTKAGSTSGSGADNGLTTEHFVLPRNGQFGAVVVGASLEEAFPEMSGIWNDRVAYTVYLHVGLKKSWILQYSLPRVTEAGEAGNVARLEAPWPFNIVRPNLAPDSIGSDALLIHGYVTSAGRFESLGVAFPPEFRQAQFVLDALNQWQFRPAAQDGQTARVEVLLIIPEERDE